MDAPDCTHTYRQKDYPCSTSLAMGLIGGKWKSVILFHLLIAEQRFSQLRRLMPAITERTLSRQLKDLEADGLIEREVFTAKPPLKVVYRLTATGESARPAILAIAAWGSAVAAPRPSAIV